MRQKVVPRANREAIAGFIRPPLQLGLVKPGTDFRHEVLVPSPIKGINRQKKGSALTAVEEELVEW